MSVAWLNTLAEGELGGECDRDRTVGVVSSSSRPFSSPASPAVALRSILMEDFKNGDRTSGCIMQLFFNLRSTANGDGLGVLLGRRARFAR
jgi:hypothetical protein